MSLPETPSVDQGGTLHEGCLAAGENRSTVREQHVKLFRNGRNQAVRIPREFELPGNDAIMRKEGERLIIEAAPPTSLLALLDRLSPITEQFPPIVELASDTVDL